jgi:hypothetical protein
MKLALALPVSVLVLVSMTAASAFADECSTTGDPGCSISCEGPAECVAGTVDDGVAIGTPGDCYCE